MSLHVITHRYIPFLFFQVEIRLDPVGVFCEAEGAGVQLIFDSVVDLVRNDDGGAEGCVADGADYVQGGVGGASGSGLGDVVGGSAAGIATAGTADGAATAASAARCMVA